MLAFNLIVSNSPSSRRRARLVRQLRSAHDSLAQWEESLRAVATRPAAGSPHDAAELLGIVNEAKLGLSQLLEQMGADATLISPAASATEAIATMRKRPRERGSDLAEASRVCVNACRSCGRALGAAFREAQKAADAASAKILYGSVRAFEKQIWVLDPRQAD